MSSNADEARLGLQLCRRGGWDAGIPHLARAIEKASSLDNIPSQAYSYLGYGLAREQRRIREGLSLCRHALRLDFTAPENHLNLARVHELAGSRRDAVKAVAEGLTMHPRHPGLLAFYREMGHRRSPVLRFLPRSNLLNKWLGLLRHRLARRS